MSRHIDMSDPSSWTEADIAYLRDRCRLPENFVPTVSEADSEDTYEDYEGGWNNDERRAELARRGLSVDGKKDELIARLLRSDNDELLDEDSAKSEDEDEEDEEEESEEESEDDSGDDSDDD